MLNNWTFWTIHGIFLGKLCQAELVKSVFWANFVLVGWAVATSVYNLIQVTNLQPASLKLYLPSRRPRSIESDLFVNWFCCNHAYPLLFVETLPKVTMFDTSPLFKKCQPFWHFSETNALKVCLEILRIWAIYPEF